MSFLVLDGGVLVLTLPMASLGGQIQVSEGNSIMSCTKVAYIDRSKKSSTPPNRNRPPIYSFLHRQYSICPPLNPWPKRS